MSMIDETLLRYFVLHTARSRKLFQDGHEIKGSDKYCAITIKFFTV